MGVKRKKPCLKFVLPLLLIFVHKAFACDQRNNFLCSDGTTCIPKSYVCNGFVDCPSKDDEQNCEIRNCSDPKKFFLCRDLKTCIARSLICDGEGDCPDNSDESDEMCEITSIFSRIVSKTANMTCDNLKQFKCKSNGVCIPIVDICNGINNCADASDEDSKLCDEVKDHCKGFRCKNQKCLESHSYVCDGDDDCGDGSDEDHCSPDCNLSQGKFLCASGDQCIDYSKFCDNKTDCSDKSDEGDFCNKTVEDECKKLGCIDGQCKLLPTGATCICNKGYKFNEESKKCEDVNECLTFGTCSQGCSNLNGSYFCTCEKGFVLNSEDKKSCDTISKNVSLVYTTRNYIKKLEFLDPTSSITEPIAKTKQSVGVAFDGDNYYWTEVDMGRETIVKYNAEKNSKEILLTNGLELPEYMAVDWLTKNIYFTDSTRKHIAVCTNDGYYCTELIKTEHMHFPRAIALYPAEGLLFWTDWGNHSHIGVANMDGSNPKILVDDVEWPNGLTIDWPNRRIYWIDAQIKAIETVKITGEDRRVILKDIFKHPFALDVYGNNLYWSDHETKSIEFCDKFTGKNHDVLRQGEEIYDIHIYDKSSMPYSKHGCEGNPCSHICLLKSGGKYSCACPNGMELNDDEHNCRFNTKAFIIHVGIGSKLYSNVFQSFGRTESTFKPTEAKIDVLEFNALNGDIFYANNNEHKIYKIDSVGNSRLLLADRNLHVTSMSFDYLGNNLYFADDVKETIEVLSLKTKKRAIVHHFMGDYIPTSVVTVPSLGEIFVAIVSQKNSQIVRLSMRGTYGTFFNGTSFTTIGSSLGKGVIYLAVDEAEKKLYWADTKKKRIEFSTFEGTERKVFLSTPDRIPGPMTLVDDYLHWTSENSRSMQWRYKNGTGPIKLTRLDSMDSSIRKSDFPRVVPITTGKETIHNNHPCATNNGNCTDICIPDGPTSRVCLCAVGRVFMDKRQTRCTDRTHCDARCDTGECLESKMLCDNKIDCLDRSDEDDKKCNLNKCNARQFKCDNGECIDKALRCDKNRNCKDGSDEWNCPKDGLIEQCSPLQSQCRNSTKCIYRTQICDMNQDCPDGSDEFEESCSQKCLDDEFKCLSGQCIPKVFKCDHKIDCYDGSDEDDSCSKMCEPNFKPCRDGHCIHERFFCDNVYDCADKFDELNCSNETKSQKCDEDKFQCPSDTSICLPSYKMCNKISDCPKGEDEWDCPRCRAYEFTCFNGHCIDGGLKCDGKSDCSDHSDEEDCGANEVSPITCTDTNYKCSNGKCLDYSKVCDGKQDCSDDEGGQCDQKCTRSKCQQLCNPSPKGVVCACREGYQLKSGSDSACVDIDECDTETSSPCSQICFNKEGSYECGCHDEFILALDGRECKALGKPSRLLYAIHNEIRQIDPDKIDFISAAESPISSMAVDLRLNKLMYSLYGEEGLYVLNLTTKTVETFDQFPTGILLAYDWITENVYMTSRNAFNKLEIHACSMTKKKCVMIYRFNQAKIHVTSIDIDPVHGFLFMVKQINLITTKTKTEIVRMRLDGTDVTTIVQDATLGDIKALSLDVQARIVYFTEQRSQSLIKCDYRGENRATFVRQSARLFMPTAIDIFENHAYILDESHGKISICKLYQDNECSDGYNVASSRHFVLAHISKQPESHNDNCKNHKCPEICVNGDQGKKCLCSNEMGEAVMCPELKEMLAIMDSPNTDDSSSAAVWITLFILIMLIISAVTVFVYYRKRGFHYDMNIKKLIQKSRRPIINEFTSVGLGPGPSENEKHLVETSKSEPPFFTMVNPNYTEIVNNRTTPPIYPIDELPTLVDISESEERINTDEDDDDQQRLIK